MSALHEINPHLTLGYSESFVPANERRWIAWVNKAEDMLGHGLDGDQSADGYSLDAARSAFEEGQSVVEYALTVKAAVSDRESA